MDDDDRAGLRVLAEVLGWLTLISALAVFAGRTMQATVDSPQEWVRWAGLVGGFAPAVIVFYLGLHRLARVMLDRSY